MSKRIPYLVGCILLTLLFTSAALAQVSPEPIITPPWDWQAKDDYGPRIVPTAGASWFHKGIDYPAAAGAGIKPVENGSITAIAYGGGWYVSVQGAHGRWTYLHIFNGTDSNHPLPTTSAGDSNWELTENATLVDPVTGDSGWARVIIYWIDKAHYRAEKVLCEQGYEDNRVLLDGHTLVYGNGSEVRSQSTVGRAATIAPVGTSGVGTGAHLHLQLNGGNDNPFYYLVHTYPADMLPKITEIDFPIPGNEIPKGDICSDYHIWVLINSEGGYDLDKVDFWVYPNNDSAQAIHLPQGTDAGKDPTFRYGGRTEPGEDVSTSAKTESDGYNTGVEPLPGFGLDEFVFMQKFPSLNLSAGEHTFAVRATDVNGHVTETATSRFIINGDASDITRSLIPPAVTTVAPGGTLGPFSTTETNNGGAAQQFSVVWYVVQPDGTTTWLPQKSATVPGCQTLTHEHTFPIPLTSGPGDFILGILATDANGNQFDYDYFTFTVTAAQ
jgi:murein DD-endopeptidase MepM/ murein hydrolase activator NlpD